MTAAGDRWRRLAARLATIISHRGLWLDPHERNTPVALRRSFACGFGAETDVRDDRGRLVITHDPPTGAEPELDEVLDDYAASDVQGPLALNVKADGLQWQLGAALARTGVRGFVFDMSVPDAVGYLRAGIPYFTRQSEYEPQPALYERAAGVWVDCFERDWIGEDAITGHLAAGKEVCLVSPELHGRGHQPAWARWATWPVLGDARVIVCTDHPVQAREALAS